MSLFNQMVDSMKTRMMIVTNVLGLQRPVGIFRLKNDYRLMSSNVDRKEEFT